MRNPSCPQFLLWPLHDLVQQDCFSKFNSRSILCSRSQNMRQKAAVRRMELAAIAWRPKAESRREPMMAPMMKVRIVP